MNPDDDDSMSANPESPRADLGYAGPAPRRRKRPGAATRWTFVEVEDRDEPSSGGPIGGAKTCEQCGEPAAVLHAMGTDVRRRYCGACQGRANRERIGPSGRNHA